MSEADRKKVSEKFAPSNPISKVLNLGRECPKGGVLTLNEMGFEALLQKKSNTDEIKPLAVYTAADCCNIKSQKWALACNAIMDRLDGEPVYSTPFVPMAFSKEAYKKVLDSGWCIRSKEDLQECLTAFEVRGTRSWWKSIQRGLDEGTFAKPPTPGTFFSKELLRRKALVEKHPELRQKTILAYDVARYMRLCRLGVICGYLSKDEAWKKMLAQAKIVQQTFSSWEELGSNFLLGREFFSAELTAQDGDSYRESYKWLLSDEDSMWRQLPWKTDLNDEKTLWFPPGSILAKPPFPSRLKIIAPQSATSAPTPKSSPPEASSSINSGK